MEGWIVAIIIIIAGLVAAFLSCDLEVKIRIRREQENDHIEFHIRWLYGLVRRSIELPELKLKGLQGLAVKEKQVNERNVNVVEEKKLKIDRDVLMNGYEKLMMLIRHTLGLSRWMKQTFSKVRCYELLWHTQIGTGDAVDTATLTGLAWSLKGSIIGYVSKHIRLRILPKLVILPKYNEKLFATRFNSILKLRTSYALIAVILLAVRLLRARGGAKAWRKAFFRQAPTTIFVLLMSQFIII
jgi:hypothetical protein